MAGQLTIDTLKASSGVLATQNGMTGIAKAWVKMNGSGVVSGSFNVSSVTLTTDANGNGNTYKIFFTTAMPSSAYCVTSIGVHYLGVTEGPIMFPSSGSGGEATMATTYCYVQYRGNGGNPAPNVVYAAFFA